MNKEKRNLKSILTLTAHFSVWYGSTLTQLLALSRAYNEVRKGRRTWII